MTFTAFYRAIYKRGPFPWQKNLAQRVIDRDSGWPEVLDLPTAAGKTSVIDIALFHLVHQLKVGERRTAPLRLFFVVDRRVVVDGTFRHAKALADKLTTAAAGPLKEARDVITRHFEVDRPLHVSVMRGGMYRDDSWTSSPVQPTICVSTVDQVGSRLLFRGYGVSPSMRPVNAGLVASDSLVFLDEAHLSEPFRQTLRSVRRLARNSSEDHHLPNTLQFVQMSATTAEADPGIETKPFGLDENPEELDTEHRELKRRLKATKVATFRKVSVDTDNSLHADQQFANIVAESALELASLQTSIGKTPRKKANTTKEKAAEPPRVVGIVVNRVRAARFIHQLLVAELQSVEDQPPKADVLLLTGRIRPFDRDELLFRCEANERNGWLSWIAADRNEDPPRPILVVATQTIEVGADVSFDALISEAAPLDCLRQRFGRLDRLGRWGKSNAVILGRNTSIARNSDDPIYGRAIGATWAWLNDNAEGSGKSKSFDFGLSAIAKKLTVLSAEDLAEMCAPRSNAPFLQPPYVELWSHTNPAPAADPDIARFLHGEDSRPSDVQVVWRSDLLNHEEKILEEQHAIDYINTVSLLPPVQMEACSVPLRDVQVWLSNPPNYVSDSEHISDQLADVEGGRAILDQEQPKVRQRAVWVLRWRGPDNSKLVRPKQIRPGDTIVVPASYGGYDRFGWQPGSNNPVDDVADSCVRWSRGRAVLRCHPAVLRQWDSTDELFSLFDLADTPEVLGQIASLQLPELPTAVAASVASLRADDHCQKLPYEMSHSEECPGLLFIGSRRIPADRILQEMQAPMESPYDAGESTGVNDASSFLGSGEPVPLETHCKGVAEFAGEFARLAGLSQTLITDLQSVGYWHDVGKIDPRFQAMLHDGDEINAIEARNGGLLLAKSGHTANDRAARNRARRLAGVPDRFRHEALSVALLRQPEQAELLAQAYDVDLVLFLVGSHHGYGRPLHPVCNDHEPPEIDLMWNGHRWRIDSAERDRSALFRLENDWPGLLARLGRRYGIWGLAWLEALFRLADHRQSQLDGQPKNIVVIEEVARHA